MENRGESSQTNKPLGVLRGYPYELFSRRFDAAEFKIIRSNCASERKICISAHGGIHDWDEDLYGFTRVVVHGVDSLCVAARTKDLDRVMSQAKEVCYYMCDLILENALIFEAEDLALPSGDASKRTCRIFEKPFVVVSVAQGPNGGHEASSDEHYIDSTVEFLKEEFASGTTLTIGESIKTAVDTLQHLFGQLFKANEIKVFYVKNYKWGESTRGEPVRVIQMRNKLTIKDHLDVIDKLTIEKH